MARKKKVTRPFSKETAKEYLVEVQNSLAKVQAEQEILLRLEEGLKAYIALPTNEPIEPLIINVVSG